MISNCSTKYIVCFVDRLRHSSFSAVCRFGRVQCYHDDWQLYNRSIGMITNVTTEWLVIGVIEINRGWRLYRAQQHETVRKKNCVTSQMKVFFSFFFVVKPLTSMGRPMGVRSMVLQFIFLFFVVKINQRKFIVLFCFSLSRRENKTEKKYGIFAKRYVSHGAATTEQASSFAACLHVCVSARSAWYRTYHIISLSGIVGCTNAMYAKAAHGAHT